jgi:hypothetical protein
MHTSGCLVLRFEAVTWGCGACDGIPQVLIGDRLVGTPYDVSFRVDHENERLCSKDLTAKDLKKFRKAVKDDYYFQVYASTQCEPTSTPLCLSPDWCAGATQHTTHKRTIPPSILGGCVRPLLLKRPVTATEPENSRG